MKKFVAILTTVIMSISLLAGCSGATTTSTAIDTSTAAGETTTQAAANNGPVKVVMSLADSSDYYIGTMVGAKVKEAFEAAGAEVEVLDAASQMSTQVQQIQNAVTQGANIIYVFPSGDAEAFHDPLVAARDAGVKVLVSNNNPGEGAFDAYVGSEEFYMGAMMAKLVSNWIDQTIPEATQVKTLILEANFNETMAHRCLGMRLVGEKFLRQADLKTMYFVKTDGQPVNYIDKDDTVKPVDEPTGGLILDKDGNAILNPFYDSRVKLVEAGNRATVGVTATEAQAAIAEAVTNGNDDLQVVITYGDVGIASSEKLVELSSAGTIKNDVSKVAVFCSDATDANIEAIKSSPDNKSVLRGVMAAGDLIQTVSEIAAQMVKGEAFTAFTMEPLSYITSDGKGGTTQVLYTDVEPLSPTIEQFFVK